MRTHWNRFFTLTWIVPLTLLASCGGSGAGGGGSKPPPPPPNPTPNIVSLSPGSASAGGVAFNLTVTGANFVSSSTVQWNGSARATTFSSSTQLQTQITATDLANSETALVTVITPGPGGGSSGGVEFAVNATSNPAPAILSLNPSSVSEGSSDLILTINGSNFISGSIIEWNGAPLTSNYLSDVQLEAQVPAANFAKSTIASVAVMNPPPGGGSTSPFPFLINYSPLIVNQAASDMIWDNNHQLLYLSVPSIVPSTGHPVSNGNSIVALNPLTGTIGSTQFAGSEPDVLAISADDQFLYAGVDGAASVQRFTLPNLLPDLKYSLGAHKLFGSYYGVDIQVAPGLPHTTVVSRGASNVSPSALGGVAIFDDSTSRPSDIPDGSFDSLQWGSDTALYAVDSDISSFDFFVLQVGASGVTVHKQYPNDFSSFYIRIHYDAGTGLVYTDDGYIINPTNGLVVGGFPASGYMVPDSSLNRAFFFGQIPSQFGTDSYTIESFDLTTLAPIAEISISNVQGYPLRFIRWGASGLALNDNAGYTYIINNDFVSGGSPAANKLRQNLEPVRRMWPNLNRRVQPKVRTNVIHNRVPKVQRLAASAQSSNPVPKLASLSPSAVAADEVGLNGFTLTVTGSNFMSFSTVEWNGSSRPTEFVSSNKLQAQINFADVMNAGSASVSVVTPAPGGGASAALPFTIVSQTLQQRPGIFSLIPNSVPAGSGALSLQVHGRWLNDSTTVQWNGSPRPTSYQGDPFAQISAADVASPGYGEVTVVNPSPGGGTSNIGEFQILCQPTSVNQTTNDMVWDPLNQVFYLSVPSSASTNANSVCILNPAIYAITRCVAGNEPNVLAISDDSQSLYVGMDGTNTVQRYILPALTPDINFSVGTDPYDGAYFALDIQVAPGAPHTIAVSRGIKNLDPDTEGGIAIYDDGVQRPTIAQGWGPTTDSYDAIQWGSDGTHLYAVNNSGGGDFYALTVNSLGVTLVQDYGGVFWNPGRIHFNKANGLIYSDDGFHAIDPSTGLPTGIFEVGGGWPMAADSTLNTVFILTQYIWQENSNYTIDLFDMSHYVRTGQVPFSKSSQFGINTVGRFLRWGTNGLAVNFKGGGNIYFLSGPFVNRAASKRSHLSKESE